jgi:hypothetical protein
VLHAPTQSSTQSASHSGHTTHHPHQHDTLISNVPLLRIKASSGDPPPRPCPPPAAQLGAPPVTSCLWGYYTGDSYNSTSLQWNDLSGNGRHAAVTRGGGGLSVGSTTRGSATFSYLQGGPSDGFRFATNFSAAAPYTFIHVTRCGRCKGPAGWLQMHVHLAA